MSLFIWLFVVIFVVWFLSTYGVRYTTGIAIGLVFSTILLGFMTGVHRLNYLLGIATLVTLVYIILYLIYKAGEEHYIHEVKSKNYDTTPTIKDDVGSNYVEQV